MKNKDKNITMKLLLESFEFDTNLQCCIRQIDQGEIDNYEQDPQDLKNAAAGDWVWVVQDSTPHMFTHWGIGGFIALYESRVPPDFQPKGHIIPC